MFMGTKVILIKTEETLSPQEQEFVSGMFWNVSIC